MKTYYLCAERTLLNNYTVSVRDNPRGCEILKKFEAQNFSEAVKRYNFLAGNMGKAVGCGVSENGTPYHFEI